MKIRIHRVPPPGLIKNETRQEILEDPFPATSVKREAVQLHPFHAEGAKWM
jgi:hypothetical protein